MTDGGNHRPENIGNTDADIIKAALTVIADDIVIQTRMIATVIQELDHDANQLLELQPADNRILFSAGMLKNKLHTDLEQVTNQLKSIYWTIREHQKQL